MYSAEKIRANLSRFKTVCLISDSIGTPSAYVTEADNYFDRMCRAVQGPYWLGSNVEATCFFPFAAQAQGFQPFGSITAGTSGPLAASRILAAGAGWNFNDDRGLWSDIQVWYVEQTGGGTLALSLNGAIVGSISTSGTGGEKCTVFSGVANPGPGNAFSLSASGGPVEVTGVLRVAAKYTERVPAFSRFSAPAYVTNNWVTNPGSLDSIIRHATRLSPALVVFSIGTNDCFNPAFYVSPAVYESNMAIMFDKMIRNGIYVAALSPVRLGPTYTPPYPGAAYEDYLAAFQRVCEKFSVPYALLDTVNFALSGLTQPAPDLAHITTAGHLILEQTLGGLLGDCRFSGQGAASRLYKPRFTASLSATQTGVTGSGAAPYTVPLDVCTYNVGGMFNTATHVATMPEDGSLRISGHVYLRGLIAANTTVLVQVTGSVFGVRFTEVVGATARTAGGDLLPSFSDDFPVAKGEVISLQVQVSGNATDNVDVVGSVYTKLSGEFTFDPT